MNRKLQFLALVLAAALLLCACGGDADTPAALSDEIRLPQIDEDYFELICQNCHPEAISGFTISNGVSFHLVSGKPLTQEDIAVTTSSQTPFGSDMLDLRKDANSDPTSSFSDELFLLYQGHSAQEVNAYISDSGLPMEKKEQMKRQLEKFHALAKEQIPALYLYDVSFNASMEEPYDIRDVTITVCGKSKTYDLDGIFYTEECAQYGQLEEADLPEDRWLLGDTIMVDNRMIPTTTDGRYTMRRCAFTVNKPITLRAIRFYDHPEIRVLGAEIEITDEAGSTVSMHWDCTEPFSLAGNTKIVMNVDVEDPQTANKLWLRCTRYMLLDYSAGGTEYTRPVTFNIWKRLLNPYEYYLALEGYDVFSYDMANSVANMAY